jgi:histidinol-phosphate aminotransferase
MANLSRRQVLLGGGLALGSGLIPGVNLLRSAYAEEIPRPDYMVRVCYNENPWGPSRVSLQAMADSFKYANLYGGADRESMLNLIGGLNNVPADHISMGTGSGEILRTAGLLASMQDGSVVCADPTYHDLVRYAGNTGSEIIRVPVDENFKTDLNAMYKAIRRDTKCVYLVNPNNPIPSIIEKNELRDFVLEVAKDRMVFIDEAYYEFVDNPDYETMMGLVRDGHKNIVVSRTASKIHGMAGLRVGFGFAHPELTREINTRKTGAMSVLSLNAAYAAYQNDEFQKFTLRKNKESLAIVEAMHEELGHRYVKSNANFSFFETGHDVQEVYDAFLKEGIIVGRAFPPMTKWLRISMAKPHEMKYFVQTYKKLYG